MQKWKIEQFRLNQFPYQIEIDPNVSDDYREYIINHHEVYEDILIKRVRNNEFLGVIAVENNKVTLFENWSENISVLEWFFMLNSLFRDEITKNRFHSPGDEEIYNQFADFSIVVVKYYDV